MGILTDCFICGATRVSSSGDLIAIRLNLTPTVIQLRYTILLLIGVKITPVSNITTVTESIFKNRPPHLVTSFA